MAFTFKERLDRKKAHDLRTIERLMAKAQSSYKPQSQGMMGLDAIFNVAKLAKNIPWLQAFGYGGDLLKNLLDKREYSMPDIPQNLMFGQESMQDMQEKIRKMNDMIQKKRNVETLKTLAEFGFGEVAEPGKEWLQGKMAKPIAKGETMLSEMTKGTKLSGLSDRFSDKFGSISKNIGLSKDKSPSYTNIKYEPNFAKGDSRFEYISPFRRGN